jgi:hypothetical protein
MKAQLHVLLFACEEIERVVQSIQYASNYFHSKSLSVEADGVILAFTA